MGSGDNIFQDSGIVRLDQWFKYWVRHSPNKVALKYGNQTFTYKQVDELSAKMALQLKAHNVRYNDVVGVALDRSPQLIITLMAIVRAGATYLPIDNSLPANRVNYMLQDAGARFLFTNASTNFGKIDGLSIFSIEDSWADLKNYNAETYAFDTRPGGIAYILYTSGSTGQPKGVQVTHANLVNLLKSIHDTPGANQHDIILATTTISFDIATLETFLPFVSGATLVLADSEIVKDSRLLIDFLKAEDITILQGTPVMWVNMLESGLHEKLNIKAFCGGEAMPKMLPEKLLPNVKELWNMYGPTETTIYSVIKKITSCNEVITIGNPVLNTTIYILDNELNEVPAGESGEIFIGGAGVGLGYVNKPVLTEEQFLDNKFTGIGKIYKTGDLGRYLANGEIEYLGRMDHQIKIRGYRIEAGEVEYQLRQLKGIKEALVTLFRDFLGNMHLAAYVVLTDEEKHLLQEEQLEWKRGLKDSLPEYMVPDIFKVIPSIPRLVNGKIDRQSLPPFEIGEGVANDFKSPATPTEISLSQIMLRHIALSRIGVNDNFFDLGLNSLVAVQVMVQVEQQFCKRLPLSTLIHYPTIEQLAAFLDKDSATSSYKCLVPIKPAGSKIPLYVVHGIGLNLLNLRGMVSYMDAEQPVYGIEPLGLHGTGEPLDDMKAIAAFYNSEILRHNPTGPYAIAGYSFGGYIAFEMVRQLKEMGKEVAMLAMFDSNVEVFDQKYPRLERLRKKIHRQFKKVSFRMRTLVQHPILTVQYLQAYYGSWLRRILSKKGSEKVYNPDNLPDYMLNIIQKLQTAFDNYHLEPMDVKVELFRAKIRMFHVENEEYLGWDKYALKGVEVFNVPGDHKLMFFHPNDKVLAGIVQKKLNQINNEVSKQKAAK